MTKAYKVMVAIVLALVMMTVVAGPAMAEDSITAAWGGPTLEDTTF